MRKLLAIVLMTGMVWVGITIYTEGARNAFGGAFSFLAIGDDAPEQASQYVSTPKAVGLEVQAAIDDGAARYESRREE